MIYYYYYNDVSSDFKLISCTEIDKEELHTVSTQEIRTSDEPPGYHMAVQH